MCSQTRHCAGTASSYRRGGERAAHLASPCACGGNSVRRGRSRALSRSCGREFGTRAHRAEERVFSGYPGARAVLAGLETWRTTLLQHGNTVEGKIDPRDGAVSVHLGPRRMGGSLAEGTRCRGASTPLRAGGASRNRSWTPPLNCPCTAPDLGKRDGVIVA